MDRIDRTTGTAQHPDDPEVLPVEEVRELFVTLSKALRAFQLYDARNPVYRRFVTSLREALARLWESLDRLEILVEEDRFVWRGEEVYRSADRKESLAFLFYRDGLREFTLLPGIEGSELERFLSAVQRARGARREGDDLITILWDGELRYFDYLYVDYLAESAELPTAANGELDLLPVFKGELGVADPTEAGTSPSGSSGGREAGSALEGAVRKEDFNPTLYSLDAGELEHLRQELRREMARDLRGDVLSALLDRLEDPGRPERQVEIVEILGTLLPSYLARGELRAAARVLEEVREIASSEGGLAEEARVRLDNLLEEISSEEAVGELLRSLAEGTIAADPEELAALLRHLRADALEPLLRAAEGTVERGRQSVLREAVRGIAEENPHRVMELIGSEDVHVAAGAIRLAGGMKLEAAGARVADRVGHEDGRVRLAVVEAAGELGASVVHGALRGRLEDPDRAVRVAAARTLGGAAYQPAAEDFRRILTGKALRQRDLSEQVAFFESYGELGDPNAVDFLDQLLNGRSLLMRRGAPEIRACAALALGRVGTEEARASLRQAERETDPVVRNAVGRALRGQGRHE